MATELTVMGINDDTDNGGTYNGEGQWQETGTNV
jgi:hypothetical protein